MARLTERAFENAVVRLRDGQSALGQSALDVLHEQREELANQMLARLAGSDEFAAMLERNFAPYRRLMTYYECAMMEVETKFRVLDAEFGLQHDRNPIESIKSRLKSADSLAKKLARKGFPMSVDSIEQNIYDVAGVRVVCTFPEDMFSLAESLLSQDDVRLIERRDYVASPKPSGYRSLHLIIEVPIFLEREREILGYLARGRSARYIAEDLVISENTVWAHVKRIYAKTGVHTKQELMSAVERMASREL